MALTGKPKVSSDSKANEGDKDHEEQEEMLQQAWDDLTGAEPDGRQVRKARLKEIGYANAKHVWSKLSREDAKAKGWKILKTRWIDINKGDEDKMDIRCRFVAKEINKGYQEGLQPHRH